MTLDTNIRLRHHPFYNHVPTEARCLNCSWTHVAQQSATTGAVTRHVKKTGHMVETIRTQRKLSGMYETGRGWLTPAGGES